MANDRLHAIIFEADTPAGKAFDVTLLFAIVTMTTVGYGDIAPVTFLGQALAATLMILGYGIIAVPTGIVSVALSKAATRQSFSTRACPACGVGGHQDDAVHCRICSTDL